MTNYDDIFQTWFREKEILDRRSPRTVDSYRDAWSAYKRYQGCTCEKNDFIIFLIVETGQ
jgi:hypothetical protein